MKLKPVITKHDIHLDDAHARVHGHVKSGDALAAATAEEVERIAKLQRVLYADARYAVLIVLQGRDASGKDGTIRKVFSAVNPQGCSVASFKAPTELEQRHDFLWRIHQQVPAHGMIGIFNRSHYEDVLVPRVHDLVPRKVWSARYDQINDFERMLSENGVVILKFMLHISRGEQKNRLMERLDDKTKNWKFRAEDLDDRALWDQFTKAYKGVLEHTSTDCAPWYIVPADDKDVRDWLIARAIADALDELDLRYPPADPALKNLVVK
ncbi:MAG: polyphosphate:nucleotide phosphotransferase, family [Gemmatimonadetes bacterium]|jgi:PPK2 family polyphosphate:nucleotide phosphotransferase|nr:polyphosphate:nucleotide phosphotransferase, family [Gemmatimonadota bacterium]